MRRFLLTSALILAGTAAVVESAFAQTADVPFTGTIGGSCSFGTVTPGTIKVAQGLNDLVFMPDVPGKVSVTCNTPAKVTASVPVQTGGPNYTPNSYQTDLKIAGTNSSYGENTQMPLPTGSTPLEVSMWVRKGTTNPSPGTYNYKVTLTITP